MKKSIIISFFVCFYVIISAQEQYVKTSDGVDLYINVRGEGMPCLYLHGGPGADSQFLQVLNGESLEKRFKMIYLDQRGCGRSSTPENDDYSMSRMIKDFEEVRKHLKIDKWLTLGHSFGGILQMGYVLENPKVINGMVMINCCLYMEDSFKNSYFPKACSLLNIDDRSFFENSPIPSKAQLDSLVSMLIKRDLMWKMVVTKKKNMQQIVEAYTDMKVNNWDFESKALNVKDYHENFLKYTSSIKQPVLFFYGKKDWCIGPNHYKGVKFPNMLLWPSDCGHMMPFLDAQKELNLSIDRFLEYLNN